MASIEKTVYQLRKRSHGPPSSFMTILVPDDALRELCTSRRAATRKLGKLPGQKLVQRVCELMAAETMEDFRKLYCNHLTPHPPPPDSSFRILVAEPLSLLIRPVRAAKRSSDSASADWCQVQEIELMQIIK